MVKRFLSKFYVFLIFLFLYAPIIVLVVYSFNKSRISVNWEGFTLKWYYELLKDRQILKSLNYTIIIAIISSVIATIIGTLSAIGIYKLDVIPKKILLNVNYLPILNPDIVTGIAFMTLYMIIKLNLGFLSMLLAHITFSIPYVILSILPKLKQLPANTLEAAMDLGASTTYALRKVILPQIKPGIVTGFLMAFTLSIDDFVISFFTTGNGVTNLSITIYSMAKRGVNPKINAVLTIMFVVVLMFMFIINRRTKKLD